MLEINIVSITPLLSYPQTKPAREAVIKYFLTQAFASVFLLLGILRIKVFQNLQYPLILVVLALILKLGTAPLHFWFPSVIKNNLNKLYNPSNLTKNRSINYSDIATK